MTDTTDHQPETEEERMDRLQTERAHAEGEHAFCGLTCEATFPSDMLRNGILARAVPGSPAMLDELLRRAAAVPPAPATTDRRARYEEALAPNALNVAAAATAAMAVADAEQASLRAEAEGLDEALRGAISASEKDGARLRAELEESRAIALSRCRTLDEHDAAAPPAPADRAATCICGHPEQQHFEDVCQMCDCGDCLVPEAAREMIAHLHRAVLQLKTAPTVTRAMVLREAADRFDAFDLHVEAGALRRMADEQPETEAEAPRHRWSVESYDPVAKEWTPGTRFLLRDHAVKRLDLKSDRMPVRRLVRETTTYTVEQLADEAQQPTPAPAETEVTP